MGSVISATGSPAITPPPAGSPGAIPDTIPASGPPDSDIAVTFDGETYLLPHTISVELLQRDGSTVTLFSESVISGSATVSIPPLHYQTALSSGGLSLKAGPEPKGSPASGGLTGFAALIHALEDLAGTANSIVNTLDHIGDQGVLWSAGSLSNSAFSSAVGELFDSATSDLSQFVSKMSATLDDFDSEVYEMTEDGQRRTFPSRTGAVEELDLLRSLRKLTRGITGLRNDVILKAKDYWKQGTAAAAALAAAEETLRKFGTFDWSGERSQSSTTSTTRTSTSTNSAVAGTMSGSKTSTSVSGTATPTEYMFTTNNGTDLSTFQTYIKTLPDGGDGIPIVFPKLPWQSYITNLTLDQAKSVADQTFVSFITLITESSVNGFGALPQLSQKIQKRIPGNDNLQERPNSDQHLRVISTANQLIMPPGSELPNYLSDPLLGQGQTIYILDAGFNTAHSDFSTESGRTVRTKVVPNEFTLRNEPDQSVWAPEDITDYNGHGTAVASVAGGVRHGVASKANLVLVKFRQAAKNPRNHDRDDYKYRGVTESALQWAWDWVLQDVLQQRENGNTGKFIINMSYGNVITPKSKESRCLIRKQDLNGLAPGHHANRLITAKTSLWSKGFCRVGGMTLITIVATGNEGETGVSLDERTPQKLGTSNNGLITVGGVDVNGVLSFRTTFDARRGGSITTYAVSEHVFLADWRSNTAGRWDDGTSFAAPAVAGLAAYFASLPSLESQWRPGSVSSDIKNYITRYHYRRSPFPIPANMPVFYNPVPPPNSIMVAYNRAPVGLCSTNAPPKRDIKMGKRVDMMKRGDPSGDFDVVVSGTVVVSSLSQSYCAVEATSTAYSTSLSSSATLSSSFTSSITSASSSSLSVSTSSSSSSLATLTSSTTTLPPTSSSSAGSTTTVPFLAPVSVEATSSTAPPPAPTINTDQGILSCGIRTDQGNGIYWFTDGDATHARDQFCYDLTNSVSPIVFELGSDTYESSTYTPPDSVNYPIKVSAKWGALDESECPTTAFSEDADDKLDGYHLCQDRLSNVIGDCDTNSHGWEFWKQGGQFFRDCITWEITSTSP